MKELVWLVALSFLMSSGVCGEVSPHKDWRNALKPKGNPGPELLLASGKKALYDIVLPRVATTQEEKAAADLALWLKEMTGAEFRVLHEGPYYKPVRPVISIGRTNLSVEDGLTDRAVDLEDEGYAIDVVGGNLYLRGGKTRGIINAVYVLLEEDLGCRWYARNTSTIPHRRTLSFRPVPRTFVPILTARRDPFYSDCNDEDWYLRNRASGHNVPVREAWGGYPKYYGGNCHTFNQRMPPGEFFESHPEYYSEQEGKRTPRQLCMTHPDVQRIVIERTLDRLKQNPDVRMIDFSPNDGGTVCECAKCKEINDAEGTNMGALLIFVNKIADAVKEQYPDVNVSTLAYLDTVRPPKTIKPRDNVLVWLCTDSHSWRTQLLYVWETERFQSNLKSWHAVGAKMVIWEYPLDYHNLLSPLPNMPVVTENMRFYAEHGAKGIFLETMANGNACPGVDRSFMRSWVWTKQMWDLSLDTRALVRDFNHGYYGRAAKPMQAYDDMLWDMWEKHHEEFRTTPGWDNGGDALKKLLDSEYIEPAARLFEQAEKLAQGNQELLDRVQMAKLPLLFVKARKGPGSDVQGYLKMVDEFEAIARKFGADRVENSFVPPDLDSKLEEWRKLAQAQNGGGQ